MNSAIILILAAVLVLLWFALGRLFKPIGKIIIELFNGAFNPMFGYKHDSKEENKDENE